MKSIKKWLEEAKEDGYKWADAAIRNYDPDFDPQNEAVSLTNALVYAFDWGKSPEKKEYWEKIHYGLENVSEVPKTLSDLVKLYEGAKFNAKNIAPNFELREPYRQTAFEATKASYEAESEDLAHQIAEKMGFWDKYEALQKEFEAHKATAEELNRSYISEHNKNYERIMKIEQLEKEIEILKNRRVVEGWIVQNEDKTYSIIAAPTIYKDDGRWIYNQAHNPPDWVDVPENDLKEFNCKIPKWEDEEPTPIYK